MEPLKDLERFLDEESNRLSADSSPAEFARNRWFVHVMSQWVEPDWPRERHLTENLEHIIEEERPDAKVILWLHNSHVAVETPPDAEPRMGWRLRERYGRLTGAWRSSSVAARSRREASPMTEGWAISS